MNLTMFPRKRVWGAFSLLAVVFALAILAVSCEKTSVDRSLWDGRGGKNEPETTGFD